MSRRFRTHELRSVTDLSGVWDFAFLGDVDTDEVEVDSIEFGDRMPVPGCFDATPAYAGRRGLAAYRTTLRLLDATPHRLVLDGVQHSCRVFFRGQRLGEHAGGFTRFALDIADQDVGPGELVVLVDNRFDTARCPLHEEYYDWYQYGGIARAAELHWLGKLWIDGVRVVTEDHRKRRLRVSIDYSAVSPPGEVYLIIECDGQELLNESMDLWQASGRIKRTIELDRAKLWSPQEPNLHLLSVRLGEDDLIERIGIRQVRVDGREILINDEPVRLLGFCRHEAHPQFGHAVPDQLIVSDVQQLRDMGCNFLRGSHYPQDLCLLDLCDEAGICVWSEAIGWNHTPEHLTDEPFLAAQEAHIDEMVAAAANRPSVILWGILNESASHDPACTPAYERLLGRLKRLDGTRPVTYASSHPLEDRCFDLADVVSVNTYPGWYHGQLEDVPGHLDSIFAHLDATGQKKKPVIISEIGAGAVYGWRDAHQTRWSEQYQAKLLGAVIRHLFFDTDRACGLSIWQFCDIRTSQATRTALARPRDFNNKGVVDEYRRPKPAYDVVKELFRALGGE